MPLRKSFGLYASIIFPSVGFCQRSFLPLGFTRESLTVDFLGLTWGRSTIFGAVILACGLNFILESLSKFNTCPYVVGKVHLAYLFALDL